MKTKTRVLIVVGILLLLAILASPRLKLFSPSAAAPGGSGQRDVRLPVTGIVLRPELLINSIRATGTILANEEVELRSEIAGKIDRIVFHEGSVVKKGDLLVKINSDEIQAQLQKLESQVKLAEDKERRRRLLFDKQNISPEDYEITMNELNSIKAELKYNQARLEKTELRAPFPGLIGLRYVSEGSYVSSATRIASLQNLEQVKVDFTVPERYAQTVKVGQSIRFTRAGSDEVYAGKIFAIEPKIDPQTRTLQVRALSRNVGGRLLPGGFAEVVLELEHFDAALLVPSQAIVPELGGQKVFILRSGKAEQAQVRIGVRTETRVQILSGVSAGDTVITTGLLQIAPGLPVQLTSVE
jgi:membrane fusion protein (multidrug efflux system)